MLWWAFPTHTLRMCRVATVRPSWGMNEHQTRSMNLQTLLPLCDAILRRDAVVSYPHTDAYTTSHVRGLNVSESAYAPCSARIAPLTHSCAEFKHIDLLSDGRDSTDSPPNSVTFDICVQSVQHRTQLDSTHIVLSHCATGRWYKRISLELGIRARRAGQTKSIR